MRFLVPLVLCTLAFGQGAPPPAPKSALDKPTMAAYARYLLLWDPRIQVAVLDPKPSADLPGFSEVVVRGSLGGASEDVLFYVSKDGKKIVRGQVMDVARSPFQADLAKLKTVGAASFGAPGAPVVITVFSDFQCPYCREEGKMLRTNVAKEFPTQARVYFKDFPLEQIHNWAKPAAVAGRCVFRQNAAAFWDYHDFAFENQAGLTADNLKAKTLEWAGTKGLNTAALGTCLDTQATRAEVERSTAEAREAGVNSTPTLFINGRRIARAVAWPELKAMIEFELDQSKALGFGGEDACCELKLPSAGGK